MTGAFGMARERTDADRGPTADEQAAEEARLRDLKKAAKAKGKQRKPHTHPSDSSDPPPKNQKKDWHK